MTWFWYWLRPAEDHYWVLLSKTDDPDLQKAILDTITDIQIYKYT